MSKNELKREQNKKSHSPPNLFECSNLLKKNSSSFLPGVFDKPRDR